MVTKEQLLNDLKLVHQKINKVPSMRLYKAIGEFAPNTFINHFGSWDNALLYCFNKTYEKEKNIRFCIQCNTETSNPKFCSCSCAAKYNNKKFPKKNRLLFIIDPVTKKEVPAMRDNMKQLVIKKPCPKCQSPITRRSKLCKKCIAIEHMISYGLRTINNFRSTYARHKYQKIRGHARAVAKVYNIPKECHACGYKGHTDLCHIKPISSFDKSTPIGIVNDKGNLVYLCKNHHWELDHGIIKI